MTETYPRDSGIARHVSFDFENFLVTAKTSIKTRVIQEQYAVPCDNQCRLALETCAVTRTLCHFCEEERLDLRSQLFVR